MSATNNIEAEAVRLAHQAEHGGANSHLQNELFVDKTKYNSASYQVLLSAIQQTNVNDRKANQHLPELGIIGAGSHNQPDMLIACPPLSSHHTAAKPL